MGLKTGFSKICITPPLSSPIVGYYQKRLVKGVIDDLYVRAAAFDDGEKKSVIIALDLCVLPAEFYENLRKTIAEYCGIDTEAVFINCSHTHTGPVIGKDFASDVESHPAYIDFLTFCVRDSAAYAIADLKDSKLFCAEGKAQNVSFVRRYRMKDGSVQTNPGVGNPDISHALGEADDTVRLLKIVREEADDIYIVNFGTHPDSVGGEYITADYPGVVCSTIEGALENTNCMFLLAPQGDVNHINPNPSKGETAISVVDFDNVPRSITHARHMGRVIAGAVLSICTTAEEIPTGKIAYNHTMLTLASHRENEKLPEARKIQELYENGKTEELPYKGMELTTAIAEAQRIIKLENGPEDFTYRFSAMKIGDLAFVGFAGEPFTEIGKRVKEASPFKHTFLCCLTDSGAYFPTTRAYSEGGYEAKSSTLAPGGDDIIVNGMNKLLNELR